MKGGLVLSESASRVCGGIIDERRRWFFSPLEPVLPRRLLRISTHFLRCQLFSTRFCCCLLVEMCEISSRFDIWYTCMNLCGYVLSQIHTRPFQNIVLGEWNSMFLILWKFLFQIKSRQMQLMAGKSFNHFISKESRTAKLQKPDSCKPIFAPMFKTFTHKIPIMTERVLLFKFPLLFFISCLHCLFDSLVLEDFHIVYKWCFFISWNNFMICFDFLWGANFHCNWKP